MLVDTNEILPAFTQYYLSILGTREPQHTAFDLTGVLEPVQLTGINAPFTANEIKKTVFSLAKGKAEGPDGFPSEFYQVYWDIIGRDITDLVQKFYNNQVDLWQVNRACITLIPKKENTISLADYRPISVISGIVKLISKLLADRLQGHLNRLIDIHQTAFIKNRSLMETFLMTRESISLRNKQKIPSVLLKVDFVKAFDTVSWDFLYKVLSTKEFPTSCILWVKNLLISSSSHLRLNGFSGDHFFHQRGLRQGDPLSPLLFILVVNTLQALIKRAQPLLYSLLLVQTSAYQFVDDTVLITEAHPKNLKILTHILDIYAKMSGLHINFY